MVDHHTLSGIGSLSPLAEESPTYSAVLRGVRDLLHAGGIPDWAASAEWLVTDALEVSRTELFSESRRRARPEQLELLRGWVERRLAREPVQYIVGYTEFFGLRLRVDSSVLIPRPETELLVEGVVERAHEAVRPLRILDVGTGSGCIALAVAHAMPEAEVVGADYSEQALTLARANAVALGLKISWEKWDVLNPGEAPDLGSFSIIVSNPPYVPVGEASTLMPEVTQYEPHGAVFVEGDPLRFYRAILTASAALIGPGGHVLFEVNPDFAREIGEVMRSEFGFSEIGMVQDLAGHWRVVRGRRNG